MGKYQDSLRENSWEQLGGEEDPRTPPKSKRIERSFSPTQGGDSMDMDESPPKESQSLITRFMIQKKTPPTQKKQVEHYRREQPSKGKGIV